jgi:exonuclease III
MKSQQLKIATWNLGRPTSASKAKNESILKTLHDVDADILVLTETNSCIDLSKSYTSFATTSLFETLSIGSEPYQQGENRVTIWTKLEAKRRVDLCNSHSAICVQVETAWGKLNVYGTVIGIYGKNRTSGEPKQLAQTDFERTLDVQLADWKRIVALNEPLCIAGDFNLSMAGSYYVTKEHRQRILDCFEELGITIPTKDLPENVDQIALSSSFLNPADYTPEARPKGLSDHHCVSLTIQKP